MSIVPLWHECLQQEMPGLWIDDQITPICCIGMSYLWNAVMEIFKIINIIYNVYKSLHKKKTKNPAFSFEPSLGLFNIHPTHPMQTYQAHSRWHTLYKSAQISNLHFHKLPGKKKWKYTLGLWEVLPCAACIRPTSLIRSKQTDTPQNKRVELEINQRACVAEKSFIKSKWVKKRQQNTYINAGTRSAGKMIYLVKKTH